MPEGNILTKLSFWTDAFVHQIFKGPRLPPQTLPVIRHIIGRHHLTSHTGQEGREPLASDAEPESASSSSKPTVGIATIENIKIFPQLAVQPEAPLKKLAPLFETSRANLSDRHELTDGLVEIWFSVKDQWKFGQTQLGIEFFQGRNDLHSRLFGTSHSSARSGIVRCNGWW